MNTKLSLLGFLLLGATLSGCGPNLMVDEKEKNQSGGYSFGQYEDSSYGCPSYTNVNPPDDRLMDGTQYYTVCAARTSTTKIKVVGYSSASRMVCAFPVQYYSSTQFIHKYDQYSQPMYKCYDAQSNAARSAELDFPSTNFNGLIVVDQGSRPMMSACLTTGATCPNHSIGQFR